MGYDFNFDFNSNTVTQDGVVIDGNCLIQTRAIKLKIKNEELHLKKAKHLSDCCVVPKKGQQWRIVTEKQFNAYAFILHLINEKRVIDEMHIAIYRINQPTVESIIELIECGRIRKGTFVISSFFNQTKKPEKWAIRLRDYCKTNNDFQHAYTHNHSKVVLCRTGKDFFVFEGSGNMSDNARIEQYLYENNEKSFSFHKQWMEEIANAT